jgi:hypothetical protein
MPYIDLRSPIQAHFFGRAGPVLYIADKYHSISAACIVRLHLYWYLFTRVARALPLRILSAAVL